MDQYPKHDIYHHIRLVRTSFFVMAVLLMLSLFIQFITESDFRGIPFLLFGIGVFISFSTLMIRLIIKWALEAKAR